MDINKSKLTTDQQAQLETYQQNEEQIKYLTDIAAIVQDMSSNMNEGKEGKALDKLGVLLVDIRESLAALNDKEAPETPDFAKPVVDAVQKLEQALGASLKAIDVKPQVNVAAPNVKVDAPIVDLSKVEKVLATLPKAFESAIKLIPKTEIPKNDYTPLLKAWEGISEQLESIDIASRMKPQFPTQLKVVNPDGSSIGSTTAYENRNDTTTDPNLVYLGKALPGSLTSDAAWQIKRYNKSAGHMSFADDVTTFTKQWSGRTTYGY